MNKDQKPELWGVEGHDEENLSHRDMYDAIEDYLDSCDPLPKKVTVIGYVQEKVEADDCDPLTPFLEWLDDEYGGDDYTTPTPKMLEASKVFVAAVLDEYEVWRCREVCQEEIDVKKWVEEYCPEWLTEGGRIED